MKLQDIEFWPFDRKTAAFIVGLSDSQLGNWLNRHDLFSHWRRGTGHAHTFVLKDLVQVASIRALVEAGVPVPKAIEAFEPYQSPVAEIYSGDTSPDRQYPGTKFFTPNHEGRWVGMDSPNSKVCLEVRVWPIFDEMYPRFKQAIRDAPWKHSHEEIEQGLALFDELIEERRAQAWKG